ncbi:odorant receptor 10-like [Ptiloglossa arizonensis]|uniref:odorant receptor 10-like n=1 Tax=Ptiloglossa arizonensis TaxID=3350558 RepID=UPI003FA15187
MILKRSDDFSTAIATIFMKFSGLWIAANRVERLYRSITLVYSFCGIFFIAWLVTREVYYTRNALSECLFNVSSFLSMTMALFKLLILLPRRKDFLHLILYLKRKFLHSNYDFYEGAILDTCKRNSVFFVCIFTGFCHVTVMSYMLSPIVVNIGRNESDRILPFTIRTDLPLTTTPYYEITFILQALSLYQTGVCYLCFDNFLFIMTLQVATQFRILQYRLENMKSVKNQEKHSALFDAGSSDCDADKYYDAFKTYVRQHQALIAYCEKLENVFSFFSLGQVLLFSMLICLDGYLTLATDAHASRRLIFVSHTIAIIAQLFMYTYSSDCLIQESSNVASAMYAAPWFRLPMSKYGRILRKDLTLVMIRSRVPCSLSGYGFFTVSLETYTKVLSTAFSYFTLLRQRSTITL